MNTGVGTATSFWYNGFTTDILNGIAKDPLDRSLVGLDLPSTESFTIVSKPEL
jgi:hypothetical protein